MPQVINDGVNAQDFLLPDGFDNPDSWMKMRPGVPPPGIPYPFMQVGGVATPDINPDEKTCATVPTGAPLYAFYRLPRISPREPPNPADPKVCMSPV
ncbi:MAG: hypothetical protein P8J29_10395, partial [Rhodospirillales bacterium]|nr:hypothetical protein [Rhodospirillales bacterium]